MTKLQIHLEHEFLADKQWWVEETEKEYILFVKYKNKTYKSYLEKESVEFAKKIHKNYQLVGKNFLIFELKNMVARIEKYILADELEDFKKTL